MEKSDSLTPLNRGLGKKNPMRGIPQGVEVGEKNLKRHGGIRKAWKGKSKNGSRQERGTASQGTSNRVSSKPAHPAESLDMQGIELGRWWVKNRQK